MRLVEVRLRNFRAYRSLTAIPVGDCTALIGKNDTGKSTVLDALEIVLGDGKIDFGDASVGIGEGEEVGISCVFEDLPEQLTLDAGAQTTLPDEYLVDEQGRLVIEWIWDARGTKLTKPRVAAHAHHPAREGVESLLSLKNPALKKAVEERELDANQASNVSMRRALWRQARESTGLKLEMREVPLDKDDGKKVFEQLKKELPTYVLFRADRPSTDQDDEAQNPLKGAVTLALQSVREQLEEVKAKVHETALEVAGRTLDELRRFDEALASTLDPSFKEEPKWEKIFKLSLAGDEGIPINKRGSGVRRLVLFSFFRAEAERDHAESGRRDIIYAVEEPETAQHPHSQRMVIDALKALSERDGCQVILSTHVPGLASRLDIASIRFLERRDAGPVVRYGTDDVMHAVAQSLGVTPDHRAQVLLCVEGPHDLSFLRRINALLRAEDEDIVSLESDPRLAMVILGGSTLEHWVNQHLLRNTGIREVHIYDRDKPDGQGNYEHQASVDEVNNRNNGDKAFLTRKREMENYLHEDAIADALDDPAGQEVRISVTDDNDVEAEIASVLGGRKRIARRHLKSWLSQEAADGMTTERLRQRDAYDEILEWFQELGSQLHA